MQHVGGGNFQAMKNTNQLTYTNLVLLILFFSMNCLIHVQYGSNLSLYDKICERVFFIYYLFEKCDIYKFLCSCLWPNYNLRIIFWLMILVESYYNLDILECIWWAKYEVPIREKKMLHIWHVAHLLVWWFIILSTKIWFQKKL